MKFSQVSIVVLAAALVLGSSSGIVHAQAAASSGLRANIAFTNIVRTPQDLTQPIEQPEEIFRGWGRDVVRIGQDYALKQGESVHDVVVVFSPASIDGYVRGDLTVVLGTVQIGPTAIIGGSLVVIGGNVTVQPGAAVHRDLVVLGGGLEAPTNFTPGGQHVAVGATALADRVRGVVPWITDGLLLGRPIVPRLSWVWAIVLFVFLVSLVLSLLFLDTVRTCADAIAARPFTTFLTGLLVLLLTGPVSVILAASVIGIAVVPFVLCAVVVAWIIGKLGVAVRLGDTMSGQTSPATSISVSPIVRHWLRGHLPHLHGARAGLHHLGARGSDRTRCGRARLYVGLPAREPTTAETRRTAASAASREIRHGRSECASAHPF